MVIGEWVTFPRVEFWGIASRLSGRPQMMYRVWLIFSTVTDDLPLYILDQIQDIV